MIRLRLLTLLLFSNLAAGLHAAVLRPTIPMVAGSPVEVANVLLVGPESLGLVRSGTSEKVELAWVRVDVDLLGQKYPELDTFRQESILLGESTIVRVERIPNYFERFLKLPATARFKDDFKVEASVASGLRFFRADYRKIAEPVRDPGFPVLATRTNSLKLDPITEATRDSFEATVDRLIHDLSEDRNSRSREIVRQLVGHAELFENLKQGLRNLEEGYPGFPKIRSAIDALDAMAVDPNNSIPAQIKLREFLDFARKEGGIDPKTLPYP